MDTPNTFPRRLRSRRAFTLIELLVVILIVAILIAVALPSFLGQTAKAQDSVVKQRLTVARTEAKAYWTSQGQSGYPATSAIVPQLNASEPGYSFVEDDSIGNSETGSGFTSAPSTTSTTAIGTFVNPEDANEITFCQRSQSGTVFCLRADETAGLYAIANASQTAAPAASPLSPSSAQAATAMTDVVYASGTGSTVADAEANAVCVLQAATPVADGGTATSTNPGDLSACSAGSYAGWNASPATVSTSSPAPTNTVAPAISGTLPGQLTASPGTWSNATGYNYQWYDCPTASVSFSGCNTISGRRTTPIRRPPPTARM